MAVWAAPHRITYFGAFRCRTLDDLLLVFRLPPLWQLALYSKGSSCSAPLASAPCASFRLHNRLDGFQ